LAQELPNTGVPVPGRRKTSPVRTMFAFPVRPFRPARRASPPARHNRVCAAKTVSKIPTAEAPGARANARANACALVYRQQQAIQPRKVLSSPRCVSGRTEQSSTGSGMTARINPARERPLYRCCNRCYDFFRSLRASLVLKLPPKRQDGFPAVAARSVCMRQ
jgi:hypothetical protein